MFQYFYHTADRIRIIHGEEEFVCSPERFAELEPDYPGLNGGSCRYWTPERAYLGDVNEYDGHDCGGYCQKVGTYLQYPEIVADVSLSTTMICGCDPDASLEFTASLKDGEGNILPISQTWPIRLTHEEEGDIDRLLLSFVNGQCTSTYTFQPGLPFGDWRIDEDKFNLVEYGGDVYKVRLLNPVAFLVYR